MPAEDVTQEQVLEELNNLEPSRWFEVLDFIGYLRERSSRGAEEPGSRELTARALRQSPMVGLWADREDIEDNSNHAQQLREEAEHRPKASDDSSGTTAKGVN